MAQTHVNAAEFAALFRDLSTWGRWGDADQRGALNHLTPERVAAAARLVREGTTVTLSWPLNTRPEADNPKPADHHMTLWGGDEPLSFAKDYIGLDYHNDTHTHIDAFSHVGYQGALYNGASADEVDATGAGAGSIEVLENGLVGRGVLLDIPRLRGVAWLEPGEHIFRDDLEAAEREQGVAVREGDILLVRTGHARRLMGLGPWDTASLKAGLHPTATTFLAERGIAALGTDTNADTAPSSTEGLDFPIHVLVMNAMGVHLLDYLWLERLLEACEEAGRQEFFFVGSPLRITGGTGSPLNPIAIF